MMTRMKRYIQHEYLKISHFTTKEWLHPVHNHNHFEIIFVHKGKGSHCISGMHYPYEGKCLFILAPCDSHCFQIGEETEFTFLKFTNAYINGVGNAPVEAGWNQQMDHLLSMARRHETPVLRTDKEADKMDHLIRLIVEEWKETKNETSQPIFLLIQALISMLKQNLAIEMLPMAQKHTDKISGILNYIHDHIYWPEQTQLAQLAETFGYSKHYLGIFFKEQTGTSLRDYVNQYRLHIIESRLLHSSLSLKEIGYELGFTDPSHLNKFFKTHKKMGPSAFREQAKHFDFRATYSAPAGELIPDFSVMKFPG